MMRAFVAVEILDEQIIKRISRFQSQIMIRAKPVEPHNLHFTMQFLGEISDEQALMIKDALKKVKFRNFNITIKGIGVFPNPKFPRVIWIGTDENGGKSLIELAQKIEDVLVPLGFRSDKPFKPHITVFRIKNKTEGILQELKKFDAFKFGTEEINNFKFKQSVLTSNGPIYSDLEEVCAKK
jgi:2'-5' RNA ligase